MVTFNFATLPANVCSFPALFPCSFKLPACVCFKFALPNNSAVLMMVLSVCVFYYLNAATAVSLSLLFGLFSVCVLSIEASEPLLCSASK